MKLHSLVIAAVMAATALGQECSSEQVTALKTSAAYKTMQTTDCSQVPLYNCKENACLNSVAAVIEIMPNCTIEGVALKKGFATQLANIQGGCINGSQPTSTTRAPEKDGCTAEQVFLTINNKYELATRAACDSPPSTDDLVAAKKLCEKRCQDAIVAATAAKPDCTVSGLNVRDGFKGMDAEIQSQCRTLAARSETQTKTPMTEPATNVPTASVPHSATARLSPAVAITVAVAAAVMRV